MKNLVLIALMALGLTACTTSNELKKDDAAVTEQSAEGQVEIIGEASASEIEEEEEMIVVEDLNEDTEAAEPAPQAYGVAEEIEFEGELYADQYTTAPVGEVYTAEPAEVRESEIFVDEPMAIEIEEGEVEMIASQFAAPEIANGFYYFATDCAVRLSPELSGQVSNVVPKGKMLWVEEHGGAWAKVYRRDGPAYVEKECLYHE